MCQCIICADCGIYYKEDDIICENCNGSDKQPILANSNDDPSKWKFDQFTFGIN